MIFRLQIVLTQATMLLFLFVQGARAQDRAVIFKYQSIITRDTIAPGNFPLYAPYYSVPQEDSRIAILQGFLASQRSPLAVHSEHIIRTADKYGLDWRLLVAITGVESGFGRIMPQNSYNAYGWANGTTRFESWENSISHVSKVLSEKYLAKGLETPYEIAGKYCPGSDTWAKNVTMYMEKIENFILKT